MNEIKFTYVAGRMLTYTVRKPDGTLRGPADRPLPETPPLSGYYTNNDRPDLIVGDMVIIKDSKTGNNIGSGEWHTEDASGGKVGDTTQVTPEIHENKSVKEKQEGVLEPKPPEFLRNLLWILRYGKKWWWLLFLAALVLLLLYILPKLNLEYQNIHPEDKTSGDSSPAISTSGPNSPVIVNYDSLESKTKQIAEKEFDPSPEEIYKDIESRPLFQQKDAMEYYIGLKVKWQLCLSSISMLDEETARVSMGTGTLSSIVNISCFVEISHYPQLKVAKQGLVIWVSGEISSIDQLGIVLSNVSLEFE